jgi:hypothetical protein
MPPKTGASSKAHVSVHMGGIAAAIAHYQDSPTPNLIIIDSRCVAELLGQLDAWLKAVIRHESDRRRHGTTTCCCIASC